ARQSTRLDAFLVSTDSEAIARAAEKEGVPVPFLRPPALAADETSMAAVLRHAIEWYERQSGRTVHSVVTLQPTTPMRTGDDIDAAIARYLAHQPEADSLVSVCEAGQMHPLTLYRASGEYAEPLLRGRLQTTRRQEFERTWWRNGAVYITRRDLLFGTGQVVGARPLAYEMPRERSVNIDEWADLELAEWRMSRCAAAPSATATPLNVADQGESSCRVEQ
ncbi:MAG: acylneuraminate cytidylyltransferase family protein, partial [Candidatus Rokubacteria bacterium]|nr:acylneuraminate cytidylyltransferase family protein [Candidatus Rokubacteria bacterium]